MYLIGRSRYLGNEFLSSQTNEKISEFGGYTTTLVGLRFGEGWFLFAYTIIVVAVVKTAKTFRR